MEIIIKEVTKDIAINDYREIDMRVKVETIYELNHVDNGLGGIVFEETPVKKPYIIDPSFGEDPVSWDQDFDLSNWGFFIAYDKNKPVGGIVLAYNTKGVNMLANREDLTVLWDIRVTEDYKSNGIGTALFNHAISWAKERNCTQLKVETQNNNVKACKFYQKQNCTLGEINQYAYYGEDDDEVMLVWYRNL